MRREYCPTVSYLDELTDKEPSIPILQSTNQNLFYVASQWSGLDDVVPPRTSSSQHPLTPPNALSNFQCISIVDKITISISIGHNSLRFRTSKVPRSMLYCIQADWLGIDKIWWGSRLLQYKDQSTTIVFNVLFPFHQTTSSLESFIGHSFFSSFILLFFLCYLLLAFLSLFNDSSDFSGHLRKRHWCDYTIKVFIDKIGPL